MLTWAGVLSRDKSVIGHDIAGRGRNGAAARKSSPLLPAILPTLRPARPISPRGEVGRPAVVRGPKRDTESRSRKGLEGCSARHDDWTLRFPRHFDSDDAPLPSDH